MNEKEEGGYIYRWNPPGILRKFRGNSEGNRHFFEISSEFFKSPNGSPNGSLTAARCLRNISNIRRFFPTTEVSSVFPRKLPRKLVFLDISSENSEKISRKPHFLVSSVFPRYLVRNFRRTHFPSVFSSQSAYFFVVVGRVYTHMLPRRQTHIHRYIYILKNVYSLCKFELICTCKYIFEVKIWY